MKLPSQKNLFGAALLATHILTWYFWGFGAHIYSTISQKPQLCWPFLQSCEAFGQIVSPGLAVGYFAVYFVIASIGLLLFGLQRNVGLAHLCLVLVTVMKLAAMLLDFRFMGNYHLIPLLLTVVYFFSRNPASAVKLTIVLLYIYAGLLKFDLDWLSGVSLVTRTFVPIEILNPLLGLVILMEVFASPFLLSQKRRVRFSALSLFGLFHLFSWHIVGYFYPLVMFTLLFPFIYSGVEASFLRSKEAIVIVILLTTVQFIPRLVTSDPGLLGGGRWMTLSMFDVEPVCEYSVRAVSKQKSIEFSVAPLDLYPRVKCDPATISSYARWYCDKFRGADYRLDLDIALKRMSSPTFTYAFSYRDFCSVQTVSPHVFSNYESN
jgi:hypothetical protein